MIAKTPSAYIAGPMRGYPQFNFPAFMAAEAFLVDAGHRVFNPARHDKNNGFNPDKDAPGPLRQYLEHDLPAVCASDIIVLLDGWERSEGARIEAFTAFMLGIPAYRIDREALVLVPKPALLEAFELINGSRNAQYGPPSQDFKRTADMWTGLLQHKLRDGQRFEPKDVAWMMMLLKASRAQHSDRRDHYVDAAGYAACGLRCVEEG